jgi:SAM-dependent methyltransferase
MRAQIDLLAGLMRYSSQTMRPQARAEFEASAIAGALSAAKAKVGGREQMQAWVKDVTAAVERIPGYRLERLLQRIIAEQVMDATLVAIEANAEEITRLRNIPRQGAGGTLELDPDFVPPDYWDGTEYHLQPGGFDGHEHYWHPAASVGGIGAKIFRSGGFSVVPVRDASGSNSNDRLEAFRRLPKADYGRIFEVGCGGSGTLAILHDLFPTAELVGCDISRGVLTAGHESAERRGLKVHLKQRLGWDTREPDASFDAVVSYGVHHELPVQRSIDVFKEMFRILRPGGDIILGDPPPFRVVEPFYAAILQWDTDHRGEPYTAAASLSDWDEELAKVGFTDVQSFSLGQDHYPWITIASKPL